MNWEEIVASGKAADAIVSGLKRQACEDVAFLRNSVIKGSIEEDDLKIFIIDKVSDHLEKYKSYNIEKELSGIFVGKHIQKEDDDILVINGVIEAKHTSNASGTLEYTESTWETIYNEKEKFFSNKDIIGWFYVSPGYGTLLSKDDDFLKNNFSDFKWNLAFIIDPIAGESNIFQRADDDMKKVTGYFMYSKTKSLAENLYRTKNPTIEDITKEEENYLESNEDFIAKRNDRKVNKKVKEKEKSRVGNNMNIRLKTTPNTFANILCLVLLVLVIILSFNVLKLNKKYDELYESINSKTTATTDMDLKVGELETRISLLEKDLQDNIDNTFSDEDTSSSSNSSSNTTDGDTEYVVQKGDTLWSISEKFYGNGSKYTEIVKANGGNDKIVPGQTIIIPKL